MDQQTYDNVNRLLIDLASDLDMEPATLKRVYVGSGEDFCPNLTISCEARSEHALS